MNLLNSFRSGFSLIEVALAVAVIAIGLLVILGLFPQGLQSARNAADNTLSATIVQDTFSYLRTQPFNLAYVCDTCSLPQSLATYAGTVSNAYDQAGFITTNWPNAYYKVMLTYQPQTPLFLTRVTATVVWPASSRTPLNRNIFMTEIAWYDNP